MYVYQDISHVKSIVVNLAKWSSLCPLPFLYPMQELSFPGISCTIFIADTVGMVNQNKRIQPVNKQRDKEEMAKQTTDPFILGLTNNK